MDIIERSRQLALASSEELYDRLVCYGFARRFVQEKSVLDVSWSEIDHGPLILGRAAESVEAASNSSEAVSAASAAYPARNVVYREADLPSLPYPDDHFDVAFTFEVLEKLEHPEELVREARRVLKPGGLFIVSTPDKQVNSNERNHRAPENRREMYVGELEEMLRRDFEGVRLYRQGAVAGGAVFRDLEQTPTALVESARPSLTDPAIGPGSPDTRFVLAVCGDIQALEAEEEGPYLLLDRDRRVFEESEDRAEDVELLQEEARRMQDTEVQAFQDTLKFQRSEIAYLRAHLERSENEAQNLRGQHKSLQDRHEYLRTQYANLKGHSDKLRTEHEHLRTQYANLKDHSEKLKGQHDTLKRDNETLRTDNETLRNQHEKLKARSDTLAEQHQRLKAHRATLENRLQSIETSGTWRLFGPYRRLWAAIDSLRGKK